MAIIKRKTVGEKTIRLHRTQTEAVGKQYEYFVTDDTDSFPLTRPVYTREEGMELFREQVTEVDMDLAESRGQEPFDRGSGGGLGGMFGMDDGGSDDDDGGLGLPFF